MKKLITFLLVLLLCQIAYPQVPKSFNYQGVARDNTGNPIISKTICLRLSIVDNSASGNVLYMETQAPATNQFGLFTVSLGAGTSIIGNFSNIIWNTINTRWLRVEMDGNCNNNYKIMGTTQFLTVPFAMYAEKSGNDSGSIYSAGTGISITGGVITNTLPDRTVSLTGSGNTIVTGTYPNFTISSTGGKNFIAGKGILISGDTISTTSGKNYIAGNGININGDTISSSGKTNAWSLTGNSNTISVTNFIGTTDSVALNFKVNNQKAGIIDPVGSTFFGYKAGINDQPTNENTGFGFKALYSNTTGDENTANGIGSLYSNTTGYTNTANGAFALNSNTTGHINTAIGGQTLEFNTTGNMNTAIGYGSMMANTTACQNISIGYNALFQQSYNNSGTTWNSDNIAIGYQALYSNQPTSTTSGYQNTAVGDFSLMANTIGYRNTAIGGWALYANTTGSANTATGFGELNNNTTGYQNTADGMYSLMANTTGYDNTAIGYYALGGNTTGNNNTALGEYSFGYGTYSNSTAIGYNTAITASYQVRIGDNSVTSIGGYTNWSNISDKRVKKDIKEAVPGLAFILKLRPITYHLDMDAIALLMHTPDKLRLKEAEITKGNILQTGFVAQEVENAAKNCGYDFSGIDKPKNDSDFYGLRYAEFVVPLVKGMQEQQIMIEELQRQVALLRAQINKLQEHK